MPAAKRKPSVNRKPASIKGSGLISATKSPDEAKVQSGVVSTSKLDLNAGGKMQPRVLLKRCKDVEELEVTEKGEQKMTNSNAAADNSLAGEDSKVDTELSSTDKNGEMKKLQFKGCVPVDEHCSLSGYHVYVDKTIYSPFNVYNAMLNQTNISFNNNKYYLLQLLEHDTTYEYATWFRWGRVGKIAGRAMKLHAANLETAKHVFTKKFQDKTGNSWDHLITTWGEHFIKFPNKYDLLKMDYGEENKEESAAKKPKREKKQVPSKLDPRIEEVIDLIFNISEFEACMKEMEYDVKKAPLGKLTTNQIKAGYQTLKKIEKCIKTGTKRSLLSEACSEFYTRIPHDFGMRVPPLIGTVQDIQIKIGLLEALAEIQIAIQMINEDDQDESEVHIKDRHYESLGCKLEPLDTAEDDFEIITTYVANSHGSTHSQYKLVIQNIYRVDKQESLGFREEIGNKMLLWHGSRLTNWAGILKQGLRIAPPEAPVTGYMFGKGVYFTDIVSKSANYCFASQRQQFGFLLLCEVALGDTCDKIDADYNGDNLPKGKSSTKGLGRQIPDPEHNVTMSCGTIVPLGKTITVQDAENYTLMYNEYVIYDVDQIRPRYLVKVKFDYNDLW